MRAVSPGRRRAATDYSAVATGFQQLHLEVQANCNSAQSTAAREPQGAVTKSLCGVGLNSLASSLHHDAASRSRQPEKALESSGGTASCSPGVCTERAAPRLVPGAAAPHAWRRARPAANRCRTAAGPHALSGLNKEAAWRQAATSCRTRCSCRPIWQVRLSVLPALIGRAAAAGAAARPAD